MSGCLVPNDRESHGETEETVSGKCILLDTGGGENGSEIPRREEMHILARRPGFADEVKEGIEE